MKDNSKIRIRPALTLAFLRATEAYQPERERLFDDRVSRDLMPGSWKVFLFPGLRHAEVTLMEMSAPGLMGSLYCRTRYIDDALRNVLRKGLDQVVILGAGFDARAYRICNIEQTHVFELDLPKVQRLKQTLVAKILGKLPAHVTFVPIDFDHQNLDEVMTTAGFRQGLKTFFIWEAVTQYLTAEGVDRTFRYMAGAAAAGSKIVFTYIQQGIIDGTARSMADQRLVSAARQAGTPPWISGFVPSRLAEYLNQRGLELVGEVGAPEFRARYLKPRDRQMSIFEGERVVLARIVGTEFAGE
jgi:methyltransferase (TIGR00027 family)